MRGRYWSDPWGPWMRIISENAAGKVGIGTTSPVADLHVFDTSSSPSLAIDGTSSANPYLSFRQAGVERAYLQYTHAGSSLNFYAPTYVMLGGNVGIGTTTPAHKLSVNGTIRAKELIVDTGWADYVFADNYRLAPLHEVEAHIKKHRHLPGIPSATEVAEQGVSLGEMQTLMMAKIEELTLHAIEQARRIERLEHENRALQGKRTQGGK